MKHIEEIQIAGTALLLCGAMFAVSAVAPKGESISKAVTNFTEAPETAAEAQAQAEAAAEDAGFTIYTQESNYDYDNYDDSGYDSSYDDTSYDDTSYDDTSSGEIQQDDPNPDTGDSGSIDGDASSDADTGNQDSSDVPDDSGITEDDPTQIFIHQMTAVMMTPVIPVTILTVTIIMIIMIHQLPMTLAIRAGNRRKTVWNSRNLRTGSFPHSVKK